MYMVVHRKQVLLSESVVLVDLVRASLLFLAFLKHSTTVSADTRITSKVK